MKQQKCKLAFGSRSWRNEPKSQLAYLRRQITLLILAIIMSSTAMASVPCSGRFVNPISDVCWSCLLPISIGPVKIGGVIVKSGVCKEC